MSKNNLGSIKSSLFTNLNESASIKQFVGILKESRLLKTVFSIYDNLENKQITNEDLAIKYIDENIKLIKGWSKEQFSDEMKKVSSLMENKQVLATKKNPLYEQIHVMLYESMVSTKKSTNVNKLHDAFSFVLEHLKTNGAQTITESDLEMPEMPEQKEMISFILNKAITEFNKKYKGLLSEEELKILNSVMAGDESNMSSTFTNIKESALTSLKQFKNELESQDKSAMQIHEQRETDEVIENTSKSITNIEKLKFNESTFVKDVTDLISLKEELSS